MKKYILYLLLFITGLANAQVVTNPSSASALQAETQSYLARVNAIGSISQSEILQLDKFVVRGKNFGWFSKIDQFDPMQGANMASAFVKFIVGGGGTSLVGNNFVESDYISTQGFYLTANTSKYISTGEVPNSRGLTSSNIGFGMYVPNPNPDSGTGVLIADQGTASTAFRLFAGSAGGLNIQGSTTGGIANSVGGARSQFISWNAGIVSAYQNGVSQLSSTGNTPNSITLDTEITLFGATYNGSYKYLASSMAYFIVTSGLTTAEAKDLNLALVDLERSIGRMPTNGVIVEFNGDSITDGTGATVPYLKYASIFCRAIGATEVNYGSPGSALNAVVGALVPANIRSNDMLTTLGNIQVLRYGTNDIAADANTTTGTAATITAMTTSTASIINKNKTYGKSTFVLTPPYRASVAATKANNYNAAIAAAAVANNAPLIDSYNIYLDTGNPTAYIGADLIHPNNLGHALDAAHLIAAYRGVIYRDALIPATVVNNGTPVTIPITMYGATAATIPQIGFPTVPTTGITYSLGAYTANDVINVVITNTTGAPITTTATNIRVQFNQTSAIIVKFNDRYKDNIKLMVQHRLIAA